MRVKFKHKELWYQATGVFNNEECIYISLEYNNEDILPVIESLNLLDEFEASVLEYI